MSARFLKTSQCKEFPNFVLGIVMNDKVRLTDDEPVLKLDSANICYRRFSEEKSCRVLGAFVQV